MDACLLCLVKTSFPIKSSCHVAYMWGDAYLVRLVKVSVPKGTKGSAS